MKFAGIHKDNKGFIFTPLSTTIDGLLVSTDPVIRVYNSESQSRIASALREALDASQEKVPTRSFIVLTEDQKRMAKEKLQRLDIKSFSHLNKKPVLYCNVVLNGTEITLKPNAHASNGKGYVNIQHKDSVKINLHAEDAKLVKAIEETFNKCE
jgi:hypothetical protein